MATTRNETSFSEAGEGGPVSNRAFVLSLSKHGRAARRWSNSVLTLRQAQGERCFGDFQSRLSKDEHAAADCSSRTGPSTGCPENRFQARDLRRAFVAVHRALTPNPSPDSCLAGEGSKRLPAFIPGCGHRRLTTQGERTPTISQMPVCMAWHWGTCDLAAAYPRRTRDEGRSTVVPRNAAETCA